MSAGRPAILAAVILSAAGAAASSRRLEDVRTARPGSAQVLYLPSGPYLKATSLGFPEVMADLIYIWSIQYYSNYEAADRFRYLEHIYHDVISELDPRYVDPYLIGSMIMSMEAGDDRMALRLLDKGIAANPNEWILPFEAGFLCYNDLRDHARAAEYFERAIRIPGVPAAIGRLRAGMYEKMGDARTSLAYWAEIHEQADSDYVREVSWRHVHDLRIEVDLERLRSAVAAYRQARGSVPPRLLALVEAGLLEALPADPEGRAYLYDRASGEVSSQSRFQLRRRADE